MTRNPVPLFAVPPFFSEEAAFNGSRDSFKLNTCDWCGEPVLRSWDLNLVYDRRYTVHHQLLLCNNCMEDTHHCQYCGDDYLGDVYFMYYNENELQVCVNCFEGNATICEGCGHAFHSDYIMFCDESGDPYCEDCFDEFCPRGVRRGDNNSTLKVNLEADVGVTIGLEYEGEWLNKIAPTSGYHENESAPKPFPWDWRFEYDSSLSQITNYGQVGEIISPPTTNPNEIVGVLSFVNYEFGRIENNSAGMHVNIGFPNGSHNPIKFAMATVSLEDVMFLLVEGGHYRSKHKLTWANKLRQGRLVDQGELRRLVTADKYSSIRRRKQNLYEIRAFASGTNTEDVVLAIAFTIALAKRADNILARGKVAQSFLGQIKTLVDELGWKKGGRWEGVWYDVKSPPRLKITIGEGEEVDVEHEFTLPNEDELASALARNLYEGVKEAIGEEHAELFTKLIRGGVEVKEQDKAKAV